LKTLETNKLIDITLMLNEPPPPLISGIEAESIEDVGKLEDKLPILLELKKVLALNDRRELEMVSGN
jgi:purine-binding chemotaxis protein CheW